MTTECKQFGFRFHPLKRRQIRVQFDGGGITSDGGGLLLRGVEKRIGVLRQLVSCFSDYRKPDLIEHSVAELMAQRVYGLALRYEDLNDDEELRNDPLLAVLVEKANPGNEALAGKSTVNRLELTKATTSRKERLQEDRTGSRGRGPPAGGCLSPSTPGSTERNPLGSGCDRRPESTESKKGVSSMATMATIAISGCISSAESSCCVHGCGRRTSTHRQEV
jgi:Transposase DDE domain group 1